jgi:hypothetical protein
MEIAELRFEMVKENEIMMPHPLERVLRGRVCYKLVSEHGNNTWPAWAHARVV